MQNLETFFRLGCWDVFLYKYVKVSLKRDIVYSIEFIHIDFSKFMITIHQWILLLYFLFEISVFTSILHFPKWLPVRIDDIFQEIFPVDVCCSPRSWRNFETAEFDRHLESFAGCWPSTKFSRILFFRVASEILLTRGRIGNNSHTLANSLLEISPRYFRNFLPHLLAPHSFPVTKVKEMSTKDTNFAIFAPILVNIVSRYSTIQWSRYSIDIFYIDNKFSLYATFSIIMKTSPCTKKSLPLKVNARERTRDFRSV